VTLSYPSSVAVRPAVRNFSCTIEPGQLVVIVGENGSGKSSLIRLLTGASELTDGALLVDGVPVKDYDMRDLRNATALLSQEGENFDTLSVAEAVGVGRWHRAKERDLVERAIDLGGATDLVKKLSRGIDTILQPVSSKQLEYPEPNDPLWDLHSELETAHQLSGKGSSLPLVEFILTFHARRRRETAHDRVRFIHAGRIFGL
jgi:ABC-type branched-subunit amino acid transport system ATPase component